MRREPQYEHDCDECVYLSDYEECDLYWCPQDPVGETLIARWHDDGPDYLSLPPWIVAKHLNLLNTHHPLTVALRRALELGLVNICPEITSPTRTNFIPTMDGGKGDGRCGGTRRER